MSVPDAPGVRDKSTAARVTSKPTTTTTTAPRGGGEARARLIASRMRRHASRGGPSVRPPGAKGGALIGLPDATKRADSQLHPEEVPRGIQHRGVDRHG